MSGAAATVAHYRRVLERYLAGGAESALLAAYDVGRDLFAGGVGILDVVRLHHQALAELTDTVRTDRAADVLAETLGAYEMGLRGFQEANGALRHLSQQLEAQVEERTEELRQSLAALQAADDERRRLLSRVVTAHEEERRRIADDLHQDSIQVITAVGLHLGALRRRLTDAEALTAVERLEEAVAAAIGRLRHLLFELRPPALEDDGLVPALSLYLEETAREDPHSPQYHLEGGIGEEPPLELREALYRVAQEALTNVRKHARATKVDVEVSRQQAGVLLRISDDGVGFDAEAVRGRPGHIGLTALRERSAMVGGWCHVASQPGCGTTVECWVPAPADLPPGSGDAG